MLNRNIKIDLHIHSKASAYKEANGYVDESKIENIDVLLSKVQENNVNLISITDHNNFDYALYKKIKELILVVNLDVDNVIDITKDRKNVLSIKAGCLEDDDLLEVVSESLDGGKEAVERRLKVYGTN